MKNQTNTTADLELFYIVIEAALKGKHRKFEFVKNNAELKTAKLIRRSIKILLRKLKIMAKELQLTYVNKLNDNYKDLLDEINEVDIITEVKKINYTINFYSEDLKVVQHMIKEFRAYRQQHRYRVWILNEYRPENDLIDYTKLPWSFW